MVGMSVKLAITTGISPFATSRKKTNTPRKGPTSLKMFEAPGFPVPEDLISIPILLVRMSPIWTRPIR